MAKNKKNIDKTVTVSKKHTSHKKNNTQNKPTTKNMDIEKMSTQALTKKKNGKRITPIKTVTRAVNNAQESVNDAVVTITNAPAVMIDNTQTFWINLFETIKQTNPFLPKGTPALPVQRGFGLLTKEGLFLPVRVLQDSDSEQLRTFLEGLSAESRYTRFHRSMPRIGDNVVYHLADRDGYSKVALVALAPDSNQTGDSDEAQGDIVGMVEYAIPKNPDELPEVAIVIADAWQGKGLGKQLLMILATLSIAGGHDIWEAEVLTSNPQAKNVLKAVGRVETMDVSNGVMSLKVLLDKNKIFG